VPRNSPGTAVPGLWRLAPDARRIRAEGATDSGAETVTVSGRESRGPTPIPGEPRRALHIRHQRQRHAILRPRHQRGDLQLATVIYDCRSVGLPAPRSRADGPERPVMRDGRPQVDPDPNDTERRFRCSLPMGRLSRSVTRAECSAGADDRYAGDGGLAQEFLHEPAGMPGHSPRPRSGKVARSQGDDGSSSSAQRCNSGRIALRSARP
jgi:hypothetical protein